MRTNLDFSPFYRSSVGFDRMFHALENASRLGTAAGLPAYDISHTSEDTYRIAIAVPGFGMDDLEITQQPNLLLVSGNKKDAPEQEYLHRGIESRSFQHRFELADYVEVAGAELQNGLLTIELKREIPEAMKPRRVNIAASTGKGEQKQLDQKAA